MNGKEIGVYPYHNNRVIRNVLKIISSQQQKMAGFKSTEKLESWKPSKLGLWLVFFEEVNLSISLPQPLTWRKL